MSTKKVKRLLGPTLEVWKRLEAHQQLLDKVEAAERACADAMAIAKAADKFADEAAVAAQAAQWDLAEARKKYAAHNEKIIAASAKERRARWANADDKGRPRPSRRKCEAKKENKQG